MVNLISKSNDKYAQCNSCMSKIDIMEMQVGMPGNNKNCLSFCRECLKNLAKQILFEEFVANFQSTILKEMGNSIRVMFEAERGERGDGAYGSTGV